METELQNKQEVLIIKAQDFGSKSQGRFSVGSEVLGFLFNQ